MGKKSTGERLETFVQNETTIEHLHRYAIACDLAKNKIVADIACGEGYGSFLLSEVAASVTGIDINTIAIEKAKRKYINSNLNYLNGNVNSIPVKDHSIDLIVSFETLEHVPDHEGMIREFKRVLKQDGILMISTPDKKHYSDIPNYKNPHHIKELYVQEFYDLMNTNFKKTFFLKQNSFFSSVIVNEESTGQIQFYEGSFDQLTSISFNPLYHICIASDASVYQLPSSIFSSKKTWGEAFRQRLNKSLSYRLGNFLLWPLKKIFGPKN
jgi:2-polyprenyl-3-methyl-5-hydroxy-6-metoxy-1,4-benzoquinol methylase